MGTCLICGQQEALVSKVHNMDAFTIECEVCGRCLIERSLPQIWKTLAGEEKSLVLYLPAYIREENRKGNEPAITWENWKEYAGIPKKTSYQEKMKKFLKLIESRAQSIDEFVPIDARTDYPLCDLGSTNELSFLENDAEEKGYVAFHRGNGRRYRLKGKGIDLLSAEKELETPTPRRELGSFVDPDRFSQLKAIPKGQFDLTKLIRICEELDLCFKNECYLFHKPESRPRPLFANFCGDLGYIQLRRSLNENASRQGYLRLRVGADFLWATFASRSQNSGVASQ